MQPNFPHEHTQTSCSNIFKYKRDENHKKVEADCDGEVICISTNTVHSLWFIPFPNPFLWLDFLRNLKEESFWSMGENSWKQSDPLKLNVYFLLNWWRGLSSAVPQIHKQRALLKRLIRKAWVQFHRFYFWGGKSSEWDLWLVLGAIWCYLYCMCQS